MKRASKEDIGTQSDKTSAAVHDSEVPASSIRPLKSNYLRMKNKILVTITLLMMLFSFGSCVMHYEGYGKRRGYKDPYYHGRHHKFGNGKYHSVRGSYWGKHRYGYRPNDHRGRYR